MSHDAKKSSLSFLEFPLWKTIEIADITYEILKIKGLLQNNHFEIEYPLRIFQYQFENQLETQSL